MKKRGKAQAQIITTVLIILVVLIAIVIVWNVVRRTVQTSSEDISIEQLTVDLEIESAYISENNESIYVSVKRRAGKGNISALKFIFTKLDKTNYIYRYPVPDGIPDELETKIYKIDASTIGDLENFEDIVLIGIACEIETHLGKKITSEVKYEFGKDLRKDADLVDKVNTPSDSDEEPEECVYEDWISQGCGEGSCSVGEIYLTRNVISGTDCTETAVCITYEACGIIADAVSYWKFDDNLNDSNGNNDGTFYGGTENYVSGRNGIGKALDFDGVDDYIKIAPASGLNFGGGNFTLVAWVKTNSINTGWYSILEYNRFEANWFGLWRNVDKFHYRVGGNGGNFDFDTPISAAKWYFVAGTYNTLDNNNVKYLNGSLDSVDLKIGGAWSPVIDNLIIGAKETEDGEFWNGEIDELMIFDRYLNAEEIASLYNFQKQSTDFTELSRDEYYDKVYGSWLGQIAGNFLGRETEGNYVGFPNPASEIYYNPYGSLITGTCSPTDYADCHVNSQTDDDTSIEWVDLHMLEQYGLDPSYNEIKNEWLSHMSLGVYFANKWAYDLMTENQVPSTTPCSDFYICTASGNTCPTGGCVPPYSGMQGYNPYSDYIDSQIEIEVFGALAPGMLDVAENYADKFARVTNEDYAIDFSKFYTMMYSEAFFEDNVSVIIDNVKNQFPPVSRVHTIIEDIKNWHNTYPDWRDTRQQIYNKYYVNEQAIYGDGRGAFWIHSTVNFASTIMSILYSGGDFDKGIQIAALAGWDNDCNSPTTAGVLGIIAGAGGIPDKWKVPIRNEYYNTNRGNLDYYPSEAWADTMTNMAQRTVDIGEQIILANGGSKSLDGNTLFIKKS